MTDVNPSVPKICVGRDFNVGGVSGQISIGENITQKQINYKNCFFVFPDGKTLNGKSWLYAQSIRPSIDAANIFGRYQELDKIDEILKDKSALVIAGLRGIGKSTLASMYLDRLEKRGEFAGIYWHKADETTEISDIVGSFFTIIGKPVKELGGYRVEDQLSLLFRELNAAPYFLVIDNFEILLDPQTNVPIKPGFSDLIEKVNEMTGRSRILFTSWESPSSERGIRLECYHIRGLDESAAMKLLRRKGLTEPDNELEKAIELSGGHPLALILLVQLIKGGNETLSTILTDDTLWIGEEGEVAERILDKVYKERLNDKERKLLQYFSLYREPVPAKAIVFTADDHKWNKDFVKKLALNLFRKSLLQRTGKDFWEELLVMNYVKNKLVDRIERHILAGKYYLSLPLKEIRTKKEDVQSLIEGHYHFCMAKEYDSAASIIFLYNLNIDLDIWGNYRTLVELYVGVLPKNPLKDKPLLDNINIHCIVLGSLGHNYYLLGEVEKAVEYYEKALAIATETGNKQNKGLWLGNLGIAYRDLGQVEKAIEYCEKAVAAAKEIGDRHNEGCWLGNIGIAFSNLGKVQIAIEYYERALVIAREIGDRLNEGTWLGSLGNYYDNLGQGERAIEYYEKALAITKEIGDKHNEGTWLGNLGLVYSNLGRVKKAVDYYERALLIAREIGDKDSEGTWLGNLGIAYSLEGQTERAIGYYEKALLITREIGDRRGEGVNLRNLGTSYTLIEIEKTMEYYEKALAIAREIDDRQNEGIVLGNIGCILGKLGQNEKAIENYEMALAIARETGDRRTEGILHCNLGEAYNNLGQVEKAIENIEKARKIGEETKEPRILSFYDEWKKSSLP